MSMLDELSRLNVEDYPFKRDAFYQIEDMIKHKRFKVVGLLGPRRCGKTVIFKQLTERFSSQAFYLNCKYASEDEIEDIFVEIYKDDPNKIFLLDEITYIQNYDKYVGMLDYGISKTTVIVTGSQSAAIERMLWLNFASMAGYVRLGFLTFNEYLRFTGKIQLNDLAFRQIFDIDTLRELNITEQDCYDFVCSGYSFNQVISDPREYLQGCLEETVLSCKNSMQGVGNGLVLDVSIDKVIDVMYAILFKLHNDMRSNSLFNSSFFAAEKHFLRVEKGVKLDTAAYEEALNRLLQSYYGKTTQLLADDLRDCIRYLRECGLIVFTEHYPDQKDREIRRWLNGDISLSFNEVMTYCKLTFKYPIFVVVCLRDLNQELSKSGVIIQEKDLIPRGILGSIVECEVKRYMSTVKNGSIIYDLTNVYEGSDLNGVNSMPKAEVDYYDPILGIAVEVTVRNKALKETHFDKFELREGTTCILLSKDKLDVLENDVVRIPYYIFLAVISSQDLKFE